VHRRKYHRQTSSRGDSAAGDSLIAVICGTTAELPGFTATHPVNVFVEMVNPDCSNLATTGTVTLVTA